MKTKRILAILLAVVAMSAILVMPTNAATDIEMPTEFGTATEHNTIFYCYEQEFVNSRLFIVNPILITRTEVIVHRTVNAWFDRGVISIFNNPTSQRGTHTVSRTETRSHIVNTTAGVSLSSVEVAVGYQHGRTVAWGLSKAVEVAPWSRSTFSLRDVGVMTEFTARRVCIFTGIAASSGQSWSFRFTHPDITSTERPL